MILHVHVHVYILHVHTHVCTAFLPSLYSKAHVTCVVGLKVRAACLRCVALLCLTGSECMYTSTVKPVFSGRPPLLGRWPLYGGQYEWDNALSGFTKVAFIERWPSYRVATVDRFTDATYLVMYQIPSHNSPIVYPSPLSH